MKKKQIPVVVREILDSVLVDGMSDFEVKYSDNNSISIQDKDYESSQFRFTIFDLGKVNQTSPLSHQVYIKPFNEATTNGQNFRIPTNQLRSRFSQWVRLIKRYNMPSPVFDLDPIIRQYEEELAPRFEVTDKDAETKTYSIDVQKRIVQFLDEQKGVIVNAVGEVVAKEIIQEINNTQDNITVTTKKKVFEQLRKITAMGYKLSLRLGENMVAAMAYEFLKKAIENG